LKERDGEEFLILSPESPGVERMGLHSDVS